MRSVGVLLAVLAFGCGGDSNAPNPAFPNAAGIYNIAGGFDGFTPSQGSFVGTVTLTQASREQGTLGGSATLTVTLGSDVGTVTFDPLSEASVTANGAIAFTLVDPSGTWIFNGTLSGSSITQGRHTFTNPGSESFPGSWTGSRPAAIAVR